MFYLNPERFGFCIPYFSDAKALLGRRWRCLNDKNCHAIAPKHHTLLSPLLLDGVYDSESDWESSGSFHCINETKEVNERDRSPFIPITIVSLYSGR